MDYLQIIHAQSCTTAIIHALKISIDEVREKRPNAVEYIDGMEKHRTAMQEVFMTLQEMEKQFTSMRNVMYNYHRENVELKQQIDKLKTQNENLLDGI